jgi:hypothetical protein
MSEKEKYAERAMGKKCANCGFWMTPPESLVRACQTYPLCDCENPQTALEKMFAGVPVAKYKLGGPRFD